MAVLVARRRLPTYQQMILLGGNRGPGCDRGIECESARIAPGAIPRATETLS